MGLSITDDLLCLWLLMNVNPINLLDLIMADNLVNRYGQLSEIVTWVDC